MSTGVCNICRAPIGGRDYNLQQDNQLANLLVWKLYINKTINYCFNSLGMTPLKQVMTLVIQTAVQTQHQRGICLPEQCVF